MHTLHWIDFAASFDSVVVVVVEERERERKKERERQYPRRKSAQQVQFVLDNTHKEREREREERTQHASTAGFRHLRARFFPRFRRFLPVSASHIEVVVVVVQKKSSRPSFEKSVEYVNALSFL